MVNVVIICSSLFSVISLVLAIISLIEVKAMQRSTHSVQFYNPESQEFSSPLTDVQKEALQKEVYDNI